MVELILNSLNEVGIVSIKIAFQTYDQLCQESLKDSKQNCQSYWATRYSMYPAKTLGQTQNLSMYIMSQFMLGELFNALEQLYFCLLVQKDLNT